MTTTNTAISHFARHRSGLVSFAKHLGASHADAQDCAQHTLTQAWLHIDDFYGSNYDGELRNWLMTILRNYYYTICRRAKVRSNYADMVADDPVCQCRGEDSYEVERIMRAIDRLSEPQRVVITAYLLGNDYRQIAVKLGLPLGTVKSRLSRVREALA
jgi:RNA polymerase sigma-70 factor (ECF subfamily)